MIKDKGTSIKVSFEYKDFVDNLRATRRSKAIGIDKKQLSQLGVSELIVKYFKENNDRFMELVKLGGNKQC